MRYSPTFNSATFEPNANVNDNSRAAVAAAAEFPGDAAQFKYSPQDAIVAGRGRLLTRRPLPSPVAVYM